MKRPKIAVIIGAGPAGLTAALELLRQSDIKPVILEAESDVGGLAKTVTHKGNRMDLGGHRFFSKSKTVNDWWSSIMPIVSDLKNKKAFLRRKRFSHIYFLGKYFTYPVTMSWETLSYLGALRLLRIGASYCYSLFNKRHPEKSLEDFMINRFGKELYLTFFRDYTEKLWGVSPSKIRPDWGAQRIKSVSIGSVLIDIVSSLPLISKILRFNKPTSFTDWFIYPSFGPGQFWNTVRNQVLVRGGKIQLNQLVDGIKVKNKRVTAVQALNRHTGKRIKINTDYVISSMPLRDLATALLPKPPRKVTSIAVNLPYRNLITVGILAEKVNWHTSHSKKTAKPKDQWIYIQDKNVKLGRLQIFNNWSPFMVRNKRFTWLGLEYFCSYDDEIWKMTETKIADFAVSELVQIGFLSTGDIKDKKVLKVPDAYPAYFGAYEKLGIVTGYLNSISNLYLVGRNGMHRYNNMDHAILTGMKAAKLIASGEKDKSQIWQINTDDSYHEEHPDQKTS